MTEEERRLLVALAELCEQYLGSGNADRLNHMFMSAGQEAVALLAKYGLVDGSEPGDDRWTDAGRAVLGYK